MKLDLSKILLEAPFQTKRWNFLFRPNKNDLGFLVCLSPVLEEVYQTFNRHLQQCDQLKPIIPKTFLLRWLKKDLLPSLNRMIAKVCALELHSAGQRQLLKGDLPAQRFQHYLQLLSEPANAAALFKKYPTLQQAVEVFLEHYISAGTEFFTRLNQDWPQLQRDFLNNAANCQLRSVKAGGDTHQGGRRVMILEFIDANKTSHKIVYKPRSLKIDKAFQQFIAWINQQNCGPHLFTYPIADREKYGWCEFVTYTACDSAEELRQFYQRSGMLIGILHLLAGSDIHHENLIAHGAYPVIVDFECLLKPHFLRKNSDEQQAYRPFVSESLMLPYRAMASDEFAGFDISAVGGKGGEASPYQATRWENAGTDNMRIVRQPFIILRSHNQPYLAGKKIDTADYQDALVNGFTAYYRLILHERDFLLSSASPLTAFQSCQVRVLLRSTSEYGKLLQESYHPKLLYYPEERQQHFAWLNKVVEYYPAYVNVISAELQDLAVGDIPFFTCRTDQKSIVSSSGQPLALTVIESGWEILQRNLRSTISEQDLLIQQQIINNSFQSVHLNAQLHEKHQNVNTTKNFPLTISVQSKHLKTRALAIARQILTRLQQLKIQLGHFTVWPTLHITLQNVWNMNFTGIDLYNGSLGIALSFAYAAQIFEDADYRAVAEQCLQDLSQQLAAIQQHTFDANNALQNCGGYSGIGGILYSLAKLQKIFPAAVNKADFQPLLSRAEPLINTDVVLDIIGGSAGCLAGLLAAQDYLPADDFARVTRLCVERILKIYPQPQQYTAEFTGIGQTISPLIGFSHGALGMAWALARYHALFPTPEVKTWIDAALVYQQDCCKKFGGLWPDMRHFTTEVPNTNTQSINTSWCHGSAGIGLAFLDLQHYFPQQIGTYEIQNALNLTLQGYMQTYNSAHSLCHGNLGNLDLLQKISQQSPDLFSIAQYETHAAMLISHMEQYGITHALQGGNAIPGLMLGLAGTAYQLLRFAEPDQVPSVLLL